MRQGTGLLRVTHELLIQALRLPADVRILAVVQTPEDMLNGVVQLVIEHPKLPERLEGAAVRSMTTEALAQALAR